MSHIAMAFLLWVGGPLTAQGDILINPSRGYTPFGGSDTIAASGPDSLRIAMATECNTAAFTLDMLVASLHNATAKKYAYTGCDGRRHYVMHPGWSLSAQGPDGCYDFSFISTDETDILGGESSLLQVLCTLPDGTRASYRAPAQVAATTERNKLQLLRADSTLTLRMGHSCTTEIMRIPCATTFRCDSLIISVAPGAMLHMPQLNVRCRDACTLLHLPPADIAAAVVASQHPEAGYWRIAGYSLDDTDTRLGGDYVLAIMDHADTLDIYYLEGTQVNADSWRTGDLKGRLYPSTPGVYGVMWLDATRLEADSRAMAVMTDADTMTIHFPSRKSGELTLRRDTDYIPPTIRTPDDNDP